MREQPGRIPMRTSAARLALALAGACGVAGASRPALAQTGYASSPVPLIYLPPMLANSPLGANPNDSITATEQQALQAAAAGVSGQAQATALLGKLMLYDRNLSPNRLEACASCHTRESGFTGGVSLYNLTDSAYPGAVFYRGGQRKANSYGYAPFAPVLHYDATAQDFVGGNFWDLRATGLVTGNPSGDQALDPPLDPLEMAMPDPACVVYRAATGQYRSLFEQVWGAQAFAMTWPSTVAQQCSQPGSKESANPTLPTFDSNNPPTVLDLSPSDRAASTQTFHQMGLSMAAYEAGPDVSAFTSKFDYAQKQQATLTAPEQAGYALFTGQAGCSQCHSASGPNPLFTNWQTANIGLPKNPALSFYTSNVPDQYGFVANPSGDNYVDPGVGGFLASPSDTNADWQALAPSFYGRFQVATLRNVAKQPGGAGFFKAYTHNGYFKSLKDVVHFYNTRDVLPACGSSVDTSGVYPPIGVTCWPAPEVAANVNHAQVGNLGLSSAQEDEIVAFLGTLSDGYVPAQPSQ